MCKVLGVGLDLCEITRMEEQLHKEHFLQRCLTDNEIAYIRSKDESAAQTLAGIWAAKEAVFKAAGTGIVCGMKDVEILHTESGALQCVLHGKAAEMLPGQYMLSITHEGGMAAAVCIRMGE